MEGSNHVNVVLRGNSRDYGKPEAETFATGSSKDQEAVGQ